MTDSLSDITFRTVTMPDMGTHIVEAWDASENVGCIAVRPIDGETLHVDTIVVDPNHRLRGIGRRLFAEAVAAYPSVTRVTASVKTDDSWALTTA